MSSELFDEAPAAAALCALLADPVRLRLVLALRSGERCVTSLCAELGVLQPTASHHLGILRQGGQVRARRDGKWVYYALSGRGLADELLATERVSVRIGPDDDDNDYEAPREPLFGPAYQESSELVAV